MLHTSRDYLSKSNKKVGIINRRWRSSPERSTERSVIEVDQKKRPKDES